MMQIALLIIIIIIIEIIIIITFCIEMQYKEKIYIMSTDIIASSQTHPPYYPTQTFNSALNIFHSSRNKEVCNNRYI